MSRITKISANINVKKSLKNQYENATFGVYQEVEIHEADDIKEEWAKLWGELETQIGTQVPGMGK